MIFFITRKYPPHIGGIERFAFKLNKNLRASFDFPIFAWGGRQWVLPLFMPLAFILACVHRLTGAMKCCYLGDGVLSLLGVPIKGLLRVPTVVTVHGRDIAFDMKLYQWIIPRCLKQADQIVCVSGFLKQECIKRGIPKEKIRVIPNGVDTDDFIVEDLPAFRKKFEAMAGRSFEGRKLLLTVARLMPKKGIESFLKNILPLILKKRKDVLYLIVGEGPLQGPLQETIERGGLRDHAVILGKLAMKSGELPAVYNVCDVFVMPNIPVADDAEGFGIVAIEAGAAGLPIVASKLDGITEAIQDGKNGYLINHDDYETFAATVLALLNDEQKRTASGQNARKYVQEHFSWPSIAGKYQTIFKELTERRP